MKRSCVRSQSLFSRPLLVQLHAMIEATYAHNTGVEDISRYVIGDEGFRKFYASEQIETHVDSGLSRLARCGQSLGQCQVLLREGAVPVRLAIYFPDALIRTLEEHDPRRELSELNFDEAASFTEEIDHFLFIARCVRQNRPFSLLELEIHANVTKYLVMKFFIHVQHPGQRISEGVRVWLRHVLFERHDYAHQPPIERARYLTADRLARRYVPFLDSLDPLRRLRELRTFSRLPCSAKIARIHQVN